jgi:ribonuclease HI
MTSAFPIFFGFADGASRHTRNIASAAWVIYQFDEVVSSGGICLGPATNNMAEYHAVIGLLTQASSLSISRIIIYLDSQLVVYQLNRIYAIRNPILLRYTCKFAVSSECSITSNTDTSQENLIVFQIR